MIPSSLYEQIIASIPIPNVEAMIVKDDSLLFLKRKNSPAKGKWGFPGGRMWKDETFKETLLRNVKEEIGLDLEVVRFIGVYNRIYPERHDVTIVFLCRCFNEKVILNEENSEFRFFKDVPNEIDPRLPETIRDSGWKFPHNL